MQIRTIDVDEMDLQEMLDQGLISAEQAEAEKLSRNQMHEHGKRLKKMAEKIDDPELRWNILSGGH